MGETQKLSFFIDNPGKFRGISDFLIEIKNLIKETKANQKELEEFSLSNVGMCRLNGGVRINLYFSKEEDHQFMENKTRAEI